LARRARGEHRSRPILSLDIWWPLNYRPTDDSAISRSMADEWDDVLKEIESLKQDMHRIVDAITLTASDLDQTWDALEKAQSDLGRLNKQVATLRALSPYTKKYARIG
jgi:septal ring factor EnvC (AmiA/AmiB activator)